MQQAGRHARAWCSGGEREVSRLVRGGEGKRRPLRRLALLSVAPLTVVIALSGVTSGGGGSTPSDDAAATKGAATATIERKTLVDREKVDGTLGYGKVTTVFNRGQGTVTKLAAEGSVVERNGVLFELDGKAVRLFYGDLPAFRRLAEGVPDGVDIQQLEANLKELGFAKGLISKPDNKWDKGTTAAVKRWQKAANTDQDGVVEDGEIVFLPKAVRVSAHKVQLGSGAQPASAVLEVTGTGREVSIDLDARKQRLAQQGAKVEVELPDGTAATGTISAVGTVAKSKGGDDEGGGGDDDSKPTLPVTVTLDNGAAGGSLDGAPLKVRLVRSTREGVLAVPVQALLALAEGGYGIEVADGTGRLIRLETGLFAEGMVEVSGNGITDGMKVVVSQ